MILDLFSYFAKYPSREGVLSIFNNGSSSHAQYAELQETILAMPDPLIPTIQSYVFGQSFESVKARIDNLVGTYLLLIMVSFLQGVTTGTQSKIPRSWQLQ